MKKWIGLLLAVAMVMVMATGCANNMVSDLVEKAQSQVSDSVENAGLAEAESAMASTQADLAEDDSDSSVDNSSGSTGSLPGDSYSAYSEAKSALTTTMLDGMSADENMTELYMTASMDLLGVTMSDLALIPLSFFGLGEEESAMALSMLGATDVKMDTKGNDFSISYKDSEGSTQTMTAKYDPATDSMTSEISIDGKFSMLSEYTKTSKGYAGQMYSLSDDGSFYTVKVSIDSPDNLNGTVGVTYNSTSEPASIFGKGDSVGADFAKDGDSWYSLENGVYSANVQGTAY